MDPFAGMIVQLPCTVRARCAYSLLDDNDETVPNPFLGTAQRLISICRNGEFFWQECGGQGTSIQQEKWPTHYRELQGVASWTELLIRFTF